MATKTLLIVDDEEAIVKNLRWALKKDYTVVAASSRDDAIEMIQKRHPGLMLLDLSLDGNPETLDGFDVLEHALLVKPELKVIVMTGHDDKENAFRAMEKGAFDFYPKPVAVEDLKVILRRASQMAALEVELRRLRNQNRTKEEFAGIIAMSQEMQRVFESVKRVAPADVAVLITGESGTGKELIAHAIHDMSSRSGKPFVPINCGAIPENLLESELFGHEKGSFTGAHATRPGKFEIADGGTVFLDEIGELPPALQVKLLRFLQDHMIERVGGREQLQVDVRILAATNQDLPSMIESKTFREDLYYRINAITLALPPLREREDDILLLATRFLHRYNDEFSRDVRGYSEDALNALHSYPWPGNVRELENRVKRAVLMSTGKLVTPEDLDIREDVVPSNGNGGTLPMFHTLKEARDDVERRLVTSALLRNNGNVSNAARDLAVSRPALHDIMKKHGIDPNRYRAPNKPA